MQTKRRELISKIFQNVDNVALIHKKLGEFFNPHFVWEWACKEAFQSLKLKSLGDHQEDV
jgi:hypothetical protein